MLAAETIAMNAPQPADRPAIETDAAVRWWVLHTKSRQEKAVAAHLVARQVEHFLPLVKQVRFYGRRKLRVDLPLFPGYVFVRSSKEEAWEVDRTRRLAQIIDVPDQQQIAWELGNIRKVLDVEAPIDPFPYLTRGVRVEVRSGPFKDIQGVVESRTQTDRLILQVDMLGQAASVEIDGALLDVIE